MHGTASSPILDGVRLTVPAEQQCCPFLDFHIHLEVRAPADAAGLLADPFTPAP